MKNLTFPLILFFSLLILKLSVSLKDVRDFVVNNFLMISQQKYLEKKYFNEIEVFIFLKGNWESLEVRASLKEK